MIERIIIENFKSFRRVDLHLGQMNLFIGTNASGKSNFFDALRVLQGIGNGFTISEILDGKPKSATSEVANLSELPGRVEATSKPTSKPISAVVGTGSGLEVLGSRGDAAETNAAAVTPTAAVPDDSASSIKKTRRNKAKAAGGSRTSVADATPADVAKQAADRAAAVAIHAGCGAAGWT